MLSIGVRLGRDPARHLEAAMTQHTTRFFAGSLDASDEQRPTVLKRPTSKTSKKASETGQTMERLEARVHAEQKNLFMRAASLSGLSLTSFVVDAVSERARQVIHDHEVMHLSAADSQAFADALNRDIEPSDRLKKSAARYRARTGS
jgi:uncharacterized protein (DUF1778 family)